MHVLVVGAGPTGLTVAGLLRQRGVACTVVERRTEPVSTPRAVHLDDECLRILQELGVAERLTTRPAHGLRLVDAQLRTMAQFDRPTSGPYGHPQANMFEQPELERLLREHVPVRDGVELVDLTGTTATLRDPSGVTTRFEASHVLGCDGAGSTVRRLAGLGWRDLGFRERWLVVDGRQARPLGTWDGVHQVCDPSRAATYMQVGTDHYRWEFALHDGETADGVDLDGLLRPWGVSADLEVVRRAEYVFRAGQAERWRSGNVFLLGDAAHQTPPFIGQGLGLGLRDAANLAWKLPLGGAVLETYESERAPHARALTRKAVTVGWALTGGQDAAAALRRGVLAGMCRVPRLPAALLDRGTPPLRRGPLVAGRAPAGQLVPQPTTDFDQQLGVGFALVVTRTPTAEVGSVAARLGAPEVRAPAAVAAWMGRHRTAALLVRPDRVVLARADRHGRFSRAAHVAVDLVTA